MRFEESLNIVMVADHVKVEQAIIGGEDHARREVEPTFVEALAQGADARSAMLMRIAEGLSHRLDQFADCFPLRFRANAHDSQQIGIELNL